MITLPQSNNGQLRGLQHRVDAQQSELDQARAQIARLEEALAAACDYAEVCAHFPGRDLLMKRYQIHETSS